MFIVDDVRTFVLVAKCRPVELLDITVRFFWSARLSQDPGSKWRRSIVVAAYATTHERALGIGDIAA